MHRDRSAPLSWFVRTLELLEEVIKLLPILLSVGELAVFARQNMLEKF